MLNFSFKLSAYRRLLSPATTVFVAGSNSRLCAELDSSDFIVSDSSFCRWQQKSPVCRVGWQLFIVSSATNSEFSMLDICILLSAISNENRAESVNMIVVKWRRQ